MSKSKTVWATIGGVLSSLLALLGVVGCCGLPILAGVLSFLGIGASQLSFFAEYRGWFIGFAILCLLFGFWQVYFRNPKKGCCGDTKESSGGCCSPKVEEKNNCCGGDPEPSKKTKSQLFQKIFLWAGAIIVIMMLLVGIEEKQNNASTDGGCCPPQTEVTKQSGCCPAPATKPETPPTSCCPGN